MQQLDNAAGKILYAKFSLGLFEAPYKFINVEREKNTLITAGHKLLAKEAGKKSVLLLKNNNQVLPLKKETKIALIGYYTNSKDDMFDLWIGQGKSNDAAILYEGMKIRFTRLSFSNG